MIYDPFGQYSSFSGATAQGLGNRVQYKRIYAQKTSNLSAKHIFFSKFSNYLGNRSEK